MFNAFYRSTTRLLLGLSFLATQTIYAGDGIRVNIVADDGYRFPIYQADAKGVTNRYYLQAEKNTRYGIQVKNQTDSRVGLVIAVDGRNIITGDRSDLRPTEKMYVLEPYASATYDGWRTAKNAVNRFYFTDAGNSYAEAFNDSSAMGVIAIAVFEEKYQPQREDWDETRSMERPRKSIAPEAAAPASPAPLARAGSRMKNSSSADSEAGTGYGEREHSPSVRVEFTPESRPMQRLFYKYEWKEVLCRKQIITCEERRPVRQNRFWPEDDNFAPPPPRRY